MPVIRLNPDEIMGDRPIIYSGGPFVRGMQKFRAEKARAFAAKAHDSQLYGDRPYVEHLAAVVRILEDFGLSGDRICAGWLHDVVEDTETTVADIEEEFGERVAKLVWAVTGGGSRESHTATIYKKIADYPDSAVVKLADRIANIEACATGDRHSARYTKEHPDFAEAIKAHVPAEMWRRYLSALQACQA